MSLPARSPLARHFVLDDGVVFLNHGSFGACPRAVLDHQHDLRMRLEREPVRFMIRELPAMLEHARHALAAFVHADPEGVGFVANATGGVNAVLRSLRLATDDELLVTNHEYNACRNTLDFVAARAGARVVVVNLPFPLSDPGEVTAAVLACVSHRTRLLLVDHVTSQTGLVLPVAEIVRALDARGVDVLVDGAHAPGMLDLDVSAIAAAYYTGNCHKWLCAPKSVGFLAVRADRRDVIHPVTISHGANAELGPGQSRFRAEFDWQGTIDPTPALCVPTAIATVGAMVDGGWPEVRRRNRELALAARDVLASALGVDAPAPASMIGSLAALPLPGPAPEGGSVLGIEPLQERLWRDHHVEAPVTWVSPPPTRLLRVSAQLYNSLAEYQYLASALATILN